MKSAWLEEAGDQKNYPPLSSKIEVETLIIGAGYTGLHAAIELLERGKEVAIIEAAQPGWGASGRNGGQVIPGLHANHQTLVGKFGKERGERWHKAGLNTASMLFTRIKDHKLECDAHQPGYLTLAHNERALKRLAVEGEQNEVFRSEHYMIGKKETQELTGSSEFYGAQVARTGGSIQPLKLSHSLARRATELGAVIYGNTPARSVIHNGRNWTVETTRGEISSRNLILATNAYTGNLNPGINKRFVKVCSFQVATNILGADADYIFPKGHAAADTRRLLHYFRRSPKGRLVMGGRAPFRTDVSLSDAEPLRRGIEKIYPDLLDFDLEYCWAGWVGFTTDDLPAIVNIGPSGFAAYGYNASGVALSCLIGSDVGKLVAGENPEKVATPVTNGRPVPFHMFSRLGAKLAIRSFAVLDQLGL